ncbi:unnamed protein product [Urochloa humidicola]
MRRLKPRRRWRSTIIPAQATRPFVADLTEQRLDKEAADEHLIRPSSGLPLPTDLSFTVHHRDATTTPPSKTLPRPSTAEISERRKGAGRPYLAEAKNIQCFISGHLTT